MLLAPRGLGGPLGVIWVHGTSMEPTLHGGDLAVVYQQDRYDVGDVVAFEIPGGGLVIHRVVETGPEGYRFQGDNRDHADPWTLPAESVVGREVLVLPRGARLIRVLARPTVLAALTAGAVFLSLLRRRLDTSEAPWS